MSLILFSLGIYPEVGWLDHIFYFYFLEELPQFPTVAVPVYIPTNSALGFLFLHIVPSTCYLLSF